MFSIGLHFPCVYFPFLFLYLFGLQVSGCMFIFFFLFFGLQVSGCMFNSFCASFQFLCFLGSRSGLVLSLDLVSGWQFRFLALRFLFFFYHLSSSFFGLGVRFAVSILLGASAQYVFHEVVFSVPFLFLFFFWTFSGSRSQVAFFLFSFLLFVGAPSLRLHFQFLFFSLSFSLLFGLQVRFTFVLGFGVRSTNSVSCASGCIFDYGRFRQFKLSRIGGFR